MKLFINSASPFARKVRIAIRELGLLAATEEITVVPVDSAPALTAANPVAQIPALVDDEGVVWSGSSLICQRLDEGRGLLLPNGDPTWSVRRLEVLADSLLEMNVRMVLELRRPESERSAFWIKRWEDNLRRGFVAAEALCPDSDAFDLGALTLAVAATYTQFRFAHIDWQATAPRIAALQADLEKRPSFIDTYPK